ncbi:MAG: COX15/CtaA family protein [Thermoanaerobaculales bacterium]|jgi:cytochrome c oxidase assembly protein subunit 15|nr:COX15/CtaA family protein [Thermoanaerobaculales bacterium]
MDAIGGDRRYAVPVGFGMAVSMWAVAYVCRLPAVMAPPWIVLVLLLAAVAWWGISVGRWTGDGWLAGARAGLVAAILNLLILGSLLTSAESGAVMPSAALWLPGFVVVLAGLAAVASMVGSRHPDAGGGRSWTGLFAKIAVLATFLLVVAGGLVTSNEAGLAVVDWPNTFGSNMFLFPLARMTGGIYYEHAHRLFGALVGLTTIGLAIRVWRVDGRAWVRRAATAAVVLVVLQGVLGGLRVTGGFTLSTSEADMAPSVVLAVAHGVLGQLFLAVVVGIMVVSTTTWIEAPARERRASAGADHSLQAWLVAILVVQLVLGAVQRHTAQGLIVHISLAAVVVVVAAFAGARAWGLYHGVRPVQQLGQWLMSVIAVQVALGIAALAVTQGRAVVGAPTTLEVTIATAHQATGALLLGLAVALALWTRRILEAEAG